MIGQSSCGARGCINAPLICEDVLPVAKPIRVIQFLLVAAVFALTVYTISWDSPYEKTEEILLTTLYTSFLFITVVDVISQFSGDPIPDTPMFLFGIAGTVMFLIAALGIFFIMKRAGLAGIEQVWRLTISTVLSGVCSLLYLLDILLIYLYGY